MALQKPLLDVDRSGGAGKRPAYRNPRVIAAVFVMAMLSVGAFTFIVSLEKHITKNPMLAMLMPLIGAVSVFALLPLVMFICYQEDFGKVNPLWPPHYMFLMKKTVNALRTNNWKITAKDI